MHTPLAIITGGSRGLGFETARQLGALGHRLVIAAKNKKGVMAAARMLKEHGHDVHPRVLDVGSARSITGFGEWAKSLGPVDVLVNAAGILPESGDKATVLGPTKGRYWTPSRLMPSSLGVYAGHSCR